MSDANLTALEVPREVEKGIKELQTFAENLNIQSVEDAEEAGNKIYIISDLKKKVEDQRTAITKPQNLALRSANAFFKRFSTPLETIDQQLREKVALFGKENNIDVFGVVHLRKNTVIEVTDVNKVPRSFMQPNMAKIKQAVKDGKEVPGITVSEDKSVSL